MRLALSDLKKTIRRVHGEVYLTPYLIRPKELTGPLGALITLHEDWLGRAHAGFPQDAPAEIVGDYRLARCLVTCLGEWYEWRTPEWPSSATAEEAAALADRGIDTPGRLRLALYDQVNASGGGYLPAETRDAALDAFAAQLGISRASLDALLYLDAGERAVLTRLAPDAPAPALLAARYNQRALEALLTAASTVEWTLAGGEGAGTVVKRVCFLARRMGVQYDVTFDDGLMETADAGDAGSTAGLARVAERRAPYALAPAGERGTADPPDLSSSDLSTPDMAGRDLRITLYGPQEVTGAPNQYGDRLARLCQALLGYRRDPGATSEAALARADLRGSARVYLHGRPITFLFDDRLLKALQAPRDPSARSAQPDASAPTFDSELEERLYDEFAALERSGESHGWHLEREPEPLVAGHVIAVPDFALTRGARRVYVEIAGYWRPEYRERKARKLLALRGRAALLVAAPASAHADFAALAAAMPVLWYTTRVSAEALLALADREFDDLAARLARLDPPRMRATVAARGHIPPDEAMALLGCYSRNELTRALALLDTADISPGDPALVWMDQLGLCVTPWRDALLQRVRAEVEAQPGRRMPLAALCRFLAAQLAQPELPESLGASLATLAGLVIARASIFDAEVMFPDVAPSEPTETPPPTQKPRAPQPRRSARRTLSEKKPLQQAAFGDLTGDALGER